MNIFYRVQPKGLDIKNHHSIDSGSQYDNHLSDGLHVFNYAWETICTPHDGYIADVNNGLDGYGNEIVVITASDSWDNGDVEGSCVDPDDARILKRFSFAEWLQVWKNVIKKDWSDVLNVNNYYDLESDYEVGQYSEDVANYIVRLVK